MAHDNDQGIPEEDPPELPFSRVGYQIGPENMEDLKKLPEIFERLIRSARLIEDDEDLEKKADDDQ